MITAGCEHHKQEPNRRVLSLPTGKLRADEIGEQLRLRP
jgi:hypothetical protein